MVLCIVLVIFLSYRQLIFAQNVENVHVKVRRNGVFNI